MADLNLAVGQTAVGKLTFSETTPPADGAVTSDNPSVATISLAADLVTWTVTAIAANADGTAAMANFSYTGTSVAPDVGPAVVPPMSAAVTPMPVAETGNFNPSGAVISGM